MTENNHVYSLHKVITVVEHQRVSTTQLQCYTGVDDQNGKKIQTYRTWWNKLRPGISKLNSPESTNETEVWGVCVCDLS